MITVAILIPKNHKTKNIDNQNDKKSSDIVRKSEKMCNFARNKF